MKKTKEYYKLLFDFGFAEGKELSPKEYKKIMEEKGLQKSPPDILDGAQYGAYIQVSDDDLSHEDFMKLASLKSLHCLHTIKNCLLFLTVLAVIGVAAAIILGIVSSSAAGNVI